MNKFYTYKELNQAVEIAADKLQAYYLDWLNNFLTIEGYARYHNIKQDEAHRRINAGRKIHNQRTSHA